MSSNAQFLRSWNVMLVDSVSPFLGGLDLSQLRCTFHVVSSDNETPNTADIYIYNLSEQTLKMAISEFDSIVLQAGYGDNPAVIFRGRVKQRETGKESNVDSFLHIMAAESDEEYNFGVVSQTVPAGSTPAQRLNVLADALGLPVDPNAYATFNNTGGVLPRGRVLWGMARTYMRALANSHDARWSIQNGVVKVIPLTGVPPGQAVKINSITGMVEVPRATDNGIEVKMLLNPLVKVGTALQINNKDIQQTQVVEQGFPGYQTQTFIAKVTDDGIYRVLAVEHVGDTRGQEWYTIATCLSLTQSGSVLAYG